MQVPDADADWGEKSAKKNKNKSKQLSTQNQQSTMLLSPNNVLERGLKMMDLSLVSASLARKTSLFEKHFGSTPMVLAAIFYDLTVTSIPGAVLTEKENSEKGCLMFLTANYFLWTYPKNAEVLASRVKICERHARGEYLWNWIRKIRLLKEKVIFWPRILDDPQGPVNAVSVDGTNYRRNEEKHPTLNLNTGNCSKKFAHGAIKFEVGLSVYESKCVWLNGPVRGGEHDLTLLRRGGLLKKLKPGKLAICDRGYRSQIKEEQEKISLPNEMDLPAVNNFKSRVRLRHESFNGRLKKNNILSNTFRHSREKQGDAVVAVAVIVQYQMDNGMPLFDA